MKKLILLILARLRLLKIARRIRYRLAYLDPSSPHPRRVLISLYSQFIKRGDLCFDVGAHRGEETDIFLELGARTICIEPQQSCAQELNTRYAGNKNVTVVSKGVSDRDGILDLSICPHDTSVSTMSDDFKKRAFYFKKQGRVWTGVEKCPVTTLDLLISQYGMPVFCKIDIEGFEEKAFDGLTKPIPVISFEALLVLYDKMKKCIDRLLTIGNYRFNIISGYPKNIKEARIPDWMDSEGLYRKFEVLKKQVDNFAGADIYAKLF